jgi:hypothetical protein
MFRTKNGHEYLTFFRETSLQIQQVAKLTAQAHGNGAAEAACALEALWEDFGIRSWKKDKRLKEFPGH